MGLFDGIKRQLRSVIEWNNPNPADLFIKWSENGDELKNASKLIVGPGQGCVFVYQGKVEAVHTKEGIIELQTANIPFWTTISKFMQAFESEHKVGIYFFRTSRILNQRWGTPLPIKYEDPKYKFPVSLRAHGNYSFKLSDAGDFFVNVVGSANRYTIEDFRQVMNGRILQPLTDFFAESRFSYAEIDANREELSAGIAKKLISEFSRLGFEFQDFRIEGTSFDEDTIRRINRIADIGAEAMAAQGAGLDYTRLQQLEALRDAAKNEGGVAGMGLGLGAGVSMGQMMAGAMGPLATPKSNAPAQPEGSAVGNDPVARLGKLKQMLEQELITQNEYDTKKQDILSSM